MEPSKAMIDRKRATIDQTSLATQAGPCAQVVRAPSDIAADVSILRELVSRCEAEILEGKALRLPGNTAFLADGRVLCRERPFGDSRYPYGQDGVNFWVSASGRMHANQGVYFLFPPPQEGREQPVAFFAGCRPEGASRFFPHSMLPIPYLSQGESRLKERYTVLGHDGAFFFAETPELLSTVRVFLDQSKSDELRICFSLYLENLTERPLETYTSAYLNPFCRHSFVETNEDRWFKKIHVQPHERFPQDEKLPEQGTALPLFVIKTHEDIDRFQSVCNYASLRRTLRMHNSLTNQYLDLAISRGHAPPNNGDFDLLPGRIISQECTSRVGYLGSPRHDLGSASFLTTGRLRQDIPVTVFNDMAIVGDLLRFVLPSDSNVRLDYVFTVPKPTETLQKQLCHPIRAEEIDREIECVRQRERVPSNLSMTLQGNKPSSPDAVAFNHFLTYLQKQVAVCTMLKGYVNPAANSLIGIRDVFQAIEAHLFSNPHEAKQKILEALNQVLLDGRCPRQYSLPVNGSPGITDLREYIDQGVWVISTIYTYLAVTGDTSLLDERVGYHQIDPNDRAVALPSDQEDTVLEHLIRIIEFLGSQRDTKTRLVLALYGDWNDAIDGLGMPSDSDSSFGTGVSVMTSLQLYQNCKEMIDLIERFAPDRFADHLDYLHALQGELRDSLLFHTVVQQEEERRIVHGWGDKQSYFVGSFCDSDGLARDGLTSNAFWTLAGMLEEDLSLRKDILAAFERLDSVYGLKTFDPGFGPEVPGVGRIVNVPIGTAENGAAYVHATAFAIAALFRMGEPQKAWDQIAKILPFASHHEALSHSPFVMPNSYLDNPRLHLTGQSMNDWQTGSSNVLLKLLVRYVFGFDPTFDCLRIAPAKHLPYDAFEFQGVALNRTVKLTYARGEVSQRSVYLNGKKWKESVHDEMMDIEVSLIPYELLRTSGLNEITITDPVCNSPTNGELGNR